MLFVNIMRILHDRFEQELITSITFLASYEHSVEVATPETIETILEKSSRVVLWKIKSILDCGLP